jgi:hypothetical protein
MMNLLRRVQSYLQMFHVRLYCDFNIFCIAQKASSGPNARVQATALGDLFGFPISLHLFPVISKSQ